jgi:hypothetical protein
MPPPAPSVPPATPIPPKSSSPWPWIVGGCLIIFVLILIAVVGLGWWGMREAKKGIDEQMNKFQPTIDNVNKEGEDWKKKAEDIRNNIPDPEELQKEMESSGVKKMK